MFVLSLLPPWFVALWFGLTVAQAPPPHVNRREGFCDKRGAMIALYPLSLKTSPYVPRVAWGRECGHRTVCSL